MCLGFPASCMCPEYFHTRCKGGILMRQMSALSFQCRSNISTSSPFLVQASQKFFKGRSTMKEAYVGFLCSRYNILASIQSLSPPNTICWVSSVVPNSLSAGHSQGRLLVLQTVSTCNMLQINVKEHWYLITTRTYALVLIQMCACVCLHAHTAYFCICLQMLRSQPVMY